MNYVFYLIANWCFLYLVQERHFNILEGGWLAAAPPLAAALGAGIGGIACDRSVRDVWGALGISADAACGAASRGRLAAGRRSTRAIPTAR